MLQHEFAWLLYICGIRSAGAGDNEPDVEVSSHSFTDEDKLELAGKRMRFLPSAQQTNAVQLHIPQTDLAYIDCRESDSQSPAIASQAGSALAQH